MTRRVARPGAGRQHIGAASCLPGAQPPEDLTLDPDERRPIPFGPAQRAAAWNRFGSERFDCLVVGGGITGASVARDAALRGLRVALVEKGDFACGTSSGSSQLIHGGLRYLENLDFDLVFEALRERWVLLQTAAPFVRPLPFLFPVYEGGRVGPRAVAVGMWLYDLLSLGRRVERHRKLVARRARELEPGLQRQGLRALQRYTDACTDDARLTLAVVRTAAAAGAACANYAPVTGFLFEGNRVVAARVRDGLSGAETVLRSRFVVNATGVWAERVLALTGRPVRPILRPSKGSHLVFPRGRLPVRHAIIFESSVDRRILFVIPWDGFTLVGTTEVEDPIEADAVWADKGEVRYLLHSANALFPKAQLRPRDARGTYAAVRPLFQEGAGPAGRTSREHEILEGPAGLATIVGGKLTTCRSMGEEMVDLVVERLRDPAGPKPPRSTTAEARLDGAVATEERSQLLTDLEARAGRLRVPHLAGPLFRRYGAHAASVLRLAEEEPEWAAPLAPRIPYLAAEVVFAARHEMATSLTDFLVRRTRLVYGAGERDRAVARKVASILAEELGWDAAEVKAQLAAYEEERARRRAGLAS